MGYKLSLEQIAFILEAFFGGISIRRIVCQFRDRYGLPISASTVLRLIVKWVQLSYEAVMFFLSEGRILIAGSKLKLDFKLHLGDIWEIDETYLPVRGKRLPLVLVRDLKTGFIIVGKLVWSVTANAIKEVLIIAKSLAFKCPKELRCDGLQSYARPVKVVFKGNTKLSIHKREGDMGMNQAMEGTIRALKDRLKKMLGLHSFKVSPIIVIGVILDFNFVRRSEALGGKTPAELALRRKPLLSRGEGWLFLLKLAKHYKRFSNAKKRTNRSGYQTSLDSFLDFSTLSMGPNPPRDECGLSKL